MRTYSPLLIAVALLAGCSTNQLTPAQALNDSSGIEYRSVRPNMVVDDLAKSTDFYVNKLGFAAASAGPDYVVLTRGNVSVSLVRSASGTGKGWCYLTVSDPARLYHDYQTLGLKFSQDLQTWGQHSEFTVEDPDGNRIDFGN